MEENFGILKNKKGLIFGALNQESLAWKAAKKIHKEGGQFVLSNTRLALRMGEINKLAKETSSPVIEADVTSIEDLTNLITKSLDHFDNPLDFVLHTPAMSSNIRKNREYGDLNYDWFSKTLDISAISFHKVLQTCEKHDALNEYASVLGISYIAAQRAFPNYSDMAEAKSILESIARSYGYRYGQKKNVRINTISQSPSMTTAASGIPGFDKFYKFSNSMSPLGNANSSDLANYICMMFSDYTRKVTMQNLYHDGGFSTCGMSSDLIDIMK